MRITAITQIHREAGNRQCRYKWRLIQYQSANSRRFAYVLRVYYLRIGSAKSNDRRRNRGTWNFVSAPPARDEEWFPACPGVKAGNEFRGAASPQAAAADRSNNTDDCGHVASIA